jgi:hypothetical protein
MAPRGVIEFVPKDDAAVTGMLRLREDVFSSYTEEVFLNAVRRRAGITRSERLTGSAVFSSPIIEREAQSSLRDRDSRAPAPWAGVPRAARSRLPALSQGSADRSRSHRYSWTHLRVDHLRRAARRRARCILSRSIAAPKKPTT